MKLRNHKSAQCHVIDHSDNSVDFISYRTRVISIAHKNGARMVECTGTYSPTTSRQITWFLQEYAPDLGLSDMKKIIGKGFVAC